jgi:hypothetical protein
VPLLSRSFGTRTVITLNEPGATSRGLTVTCADAAAAGIRIAAVAPAAMSVFFIGICSPQWF